MRQGKFLGEKLLTQDYPKCVWITEVSSRALLEQPDKNERRCLGRVVVGSTAPARTTGVIAVHFADMFVI
jgi:hypothetical protein